jgi:hypothetical protein
MFCNADESLVAIYERLSIVLEVMFVIHFYLMVENSGQTVGKGSSSKEKDSRHLYTVLLLFRENCSRFLDQ